MIPYMCVLLDKEGAGVGEVFMIENGKAITIEAEEDAVGIYVISRTSTGLAESAPFMFPKGADLVKLEIITRYRLSKGITYELRMK